MNLVSTPLLPEGFKVPASRNEAPSKRLRRLLAEKPYVFAPGVYDPMGAQLVMYHGFDAVYFSGYSFAIGHLGTTDMDLYSSVEIADGARRTVSALRKFQLTMAMGDPDKKVPPTHLEIPPVVVDMDAGYGNLFNVQRTVELYLNAGVAAAHLEDQVMPKRCGHIAGKALIAADEFVGKLKMMRSVADDLGHPDFIIIARTDGVSATEAPESKRGLELAIDRGLRCLDSRARPAVVRVSDRRARADRDLLHRDPQALPQGEVCFQLLVLVQVVQREEPDHVGRAGPAGYRLHLHHARPAARRRPRHVGPPRRPEARQGRGLHGAAAQGMGGGRHHPDEVAPPLHRSAVSPPRGAGARRVPVEPQYRRTPGDLEGRLASPPRSPGRVARSFPSRSPGEGGPDREAIRVGWGRLNFSP